MSGLQEVMLRTEAEGLSLNQMSERLLGQLQLGIGRYSLIDLPPGFHHDLSRAVVVHTDSGVYIDRHVLEQAPAHARDQMLQIIARQQKPPLSETMPQKPKPFTQYELETGVAEILREIQTPRPGETVEVGFLVTELVLVVNRLVGEVRDLKATIYGLQNPPIKDEPFKLPSVAGEYE